MAAQKSDWTDYVLEGGAALFVVALIGMSVAGAFFGVPEKYFAMRCVAAALAFVGDLAAIAAFKKMVRHYGRRKGKFFASAVCWAVLSCITMGSATLCLQWVFKVANKPQENHQQHVQTAQSFLSRVQEKLLSTDAKERRAAKLAAPTAQGDLRRAMAESYETVQNIANGNEWAYVIALFVLSYLLLAAAGEDEAEEAPAWLSAKGITPPAVPASISAATPPPSLPTPPPSSGKKPENPRISMENRRISAENSGNVVDFAARRKRKMPTAEEVFAMRAIDEATGKPRYTYEEIAAHFGCSEKTCRNRMEAVKRRQAAMQSAAA